MRANLSWSSSNSSADAPIASLWRTPVAAKQQADVLANWQRCVGAAQLEVTYHKEQIWSETLHAARIEQSLCALTADKPIRLDWFSNAASLELWVTFDRRLFSLSQVVAISRQAYCDTVQKCLPSFDSKRSSHFATSAVPALPSGHANDVIEHQYHQYLDAEQVNKLKLNSAKLGVSAPVLFTAVLHWLSQRHFELAHNTIWLSISDEQYRERLSALMCDIPLDKYWQQHVTELHSTQLSGQRARLQTSPLPLAEIEFLASVVTVQDLRSYIGTRSTIPLRLLIAVDDQFGWHIQFNAKASLLEHQHGQWLVEQFMHLLIQCASQAVPSQTPLTFADVPLVATTLPQRDLSAQLFFQLSQQPERIAINLAGQAFSYGQLAGQVAQVQTQLQQLGVMAGSRIGLHLPRSVAMVAAQLACLMSGHTFIPLDPSFPTARLMDIATQAEPHLILTHAPHSELAAQFTSVLISETGPHNALELVPNASAPAYMMFTSGSTGRPKGVVVSRQALSSFIDAATTRLALTGQEHWLAQTTFAFDIALLELYAPLATGAMLSLTTEQQNKDLLATLTAWQTQGQLPLTHIQATPTFWRALVQNGWLGDKALHALCGGEALDSSLAQQLSRRVNTLWNCYGPTEATVWSMMAKVVLSGHKAPMLQGSLMHYQHMVVDAEQNPLGVGMVGELCILGPALADEYWQQPDLTAQQFRSTSTQRRYYRSGDLVRKLGDDSFAYLGRVDQQIKLRGYRIEIGDIEAHIQVLAGVAEVAVVLQGDSQSGTLVAFIVQEPSVALSKLQLRKALQLVLPSYMVPAKIQFCAALPKTLNGKLDRKALVHSS
ncbi:amino acid adenylation domain-containing protein [Pseudoalteromonas fenneropenaei]|uniref:Amino acid adenylation domain-containing protein n=1 Tax=Pseudoalteromonas fenneropenaei TaxID=1737459 RepID=A0ABV7CPW8_9GAMM